MNIRTLVAPACLISLLTLGACTRQGEETDVAAPPAEEAGASTAGQTAQTPPGQMSDEELKKSLPPPKITPVTVEITLSPQADAELKRTGEAISLEIIYGGDPTQAASSRVNDLGVIELGRVKKELKGAEKVTFSEDVINKSLLPLTIGQPQVMINVISAKKVLKKNILSCEFYWDTLSVAGQGVVKIPCKLLSEVKS